MFLSSPHCSSPDETDSASAAAAAASIATAVAATVAAKRPLHGRRCAGHSSRWRWWWHVPAGGGASLLRGGWVKNGDASGGLQPRAKSAMRMLLLAAALGLILLPLLSQTHMPGSSRKGSGCCFCLQGESRAATPTNTQQVELLLPYSVQHRQAGRRAESQKSENMGFWKISEALSRWEHRGHEKKKRTCVAREVSRSTAGGRTAPSSSTMVSGSGSDACRVLRREFVGVETLLLCAWPFLRSCCFH